VKDANDISSPSHPTGSASPPYLGGVTPIPGRYRFPMQWAEFHEAARAISWLAYLGTADADGRPHVSVVSPGLETEGTIWFATRSSSKKARNIAVNPPVAFHWPVGGQGPGELVARGTATIHGAQEDRDRLWDAGVVPFDLAGFFGSKENPDLVFVEVAVERARLLGPEFIPLVWTP
jgi:general stress protein 26